MSTVHIAKNGLKCHAFITHDWIEEKAFYIATCPIITESPLTKTTLGQWIKIRKQFAIVTIILLMMAYEVSVRYCKSKPVYYS